MKKKMYIGQSACNARDLSSVPGLGRSLEKGIFPGESQYSCLANSMNRGAWQAIFHGVPESNTNERLTHNAHIGHDPFTT